MRRIAVINQKGGVGKTTTTVNLAAALARLGHRTLVCDLDPQCNLTVHLDQDPAGDAPSLYDVFHARATLADVVRNCSQEGLEIAPASIDLAGVELELATEVGREMILRHALERDETDRPDRYDYVLVDCPPSLGLLSLNALVACEELFVPIQAEFFALQGLGKLLEITELVRSRLNPRLRIGAMVSCRHDPSTNLSKAVIADVEKHFGDIMLASRIRRDIKLAEAPSHGKTIFEYAPGSRGAQDYLALAVELSGGAAGTAGAAGAAGPAADTAAAADTAPAADADTAPAAAADTAPAADVAAGAEAAPAAGTAADVEFVTGTGAGAEPATEPDTAAGTAADAEPAAGVGADTGAGTAAGALPTPDPADAAPLAARYAPRPVARPRRPADCMPPEDLEDGLTPAQRFLRKSGDGPERKWKEAR